MALTDGLVAYYKLDGDATDVSGNGHNGTVHGATVTTGKINQCYNFDGNDDDITLSDTSALGFLGSNNRAISYWFKTTSTGINTLSSMNLDSFSSGEFFSVRLENGNRIWLRPSTYTRSWIQIYNDGNWHHLVIVLNGTTSSDVSAYFDGELLTPSSTNNGILNTKNAPFRLGKEWDEGFVFDGNIDEVGIWSRALTEEEVTQLYNNGDGLSYPFTTSIGKKSDVLFFGGGF